ncbi:MAG: hypothetical protein H0W84_04015 [Bacteroidetes bacterium]|nr:hypothetical protein [Bacteroidota bacterium]
MKNTSQKFLLSKTEIVFNKEKLLDLLNASDDCNIVVVTTSHFNVDNQIQILHQIDPMYLDKKSGEMIPPQKTNKKTAHNTMAATASDSVMSAGSVAPASSDNTVSGVQLPPCPYPPGCDTTSLIARAASISSTLGVK